jgi:hypothetical protein
MPSSTLEEKRAELDAINKEIEEDSQRRLLRDADSRKTKRDRRMQLEREIAAGEGSQYAEPQPIGLVIGDEWHLASLFAGEAVLFCGDVDTTSSSLFRFAGVEEIRLRTYDLDIEAEGLRVKGLDVYGLFIVRNSLWRSETQAAVSKCSLNYKESSWTNVEHFIVRAKGGELSCLARSYESRSVALSIGQIRERVGFWRGLGD